MPGFININDQFTLPDYAKVMAEGAALYGQRQQQERFDAEYNRGIAMRDNADQARQLAVGGDIKGAKALAQSGNNWDAYDALDKAEMARQTSHMTTVGGMADGFLKIPVADRPAAFDAQIGLFKQMGWRDDEIAAARQGIGNDQYLASVRDAGISAKDRWERANKVADAATEQRYKIELDSRKIQDNEVTGESFRVGEDGELIPVSAGGIKPQLLETKNEDGTVTYTPYGGSAVPSLLSGDVPTGAARIMNYKAKAAGYAAVPANIQTSGQFADWTKGLNREGMKYTAAGVYQITGETWRDFAPKALGPNWRDAKFDDPAVQDAVGKAIYDST
ncbi:MAG: hypothetical protein EOO77_27045, partial [Oxalobacteraceae bacterium]